MRPDGTVVIAQHDNYESEIYIGGEGMPADFTGHSGGNGWAEAVTSDEKNRTIVVGTQWDRLGVQRFTKKGLPDATFGFGGSASPDIGGRVKWVHAIEVAPDGDYVVSASLEDGASILVRFEGGSNKIGTQPPVADAGSSHEVNAGKETVSFNVIYGSEKTILRKSIGHDDVYLRGPDGYRASARLVKSEKVYRGRQHVTTYIVEAPGGSWDVAEAGKYDVIVRKKAVRDNFGNYVPAGKIGTLDVRVFRAPSPAETQATQTSEAASVFGKKRISAARSMALAPDIDVLE